MSRLAFLLFTLLPIACFSQINIINRSLTDSSLNIVYIGENNEIELIGLKNNKETIFFSTTNGTMTNIGQNRYILRPAKIAECIINFQIKREKIASRVFKIDTLTTLIVRLAGVKGAVASVNQILVNPFLYIDFPGTYYKNKIFISSFSATFISDDLDSLITHSVGNLLTNEQKELIKKLDSGDKIFFDQIYAFGPDSRRRKLKSFTITIK